MAIPADSLNRHTDTYIDICHVQRTSRAWTGKQLLTNPTR